MDKKPYRICMCNLYKFYLRVQGNTSNIIFLKSTDDSMLDTLQKMSGITHKVVKDSKTVTQDIAKIWMRTEGKVSYNMSAKEFPVITYNDMAFIPAQNSIVFRAGDSPIWNRNQTMLPMSWQLFANTIEQPGKKYSLQTIPTLSTAMEFDVRKNQPDFEQMLKKRMAQARASKVAQEKYQDAYQYSDFQIMQLDQDIYSEEVMEIVNDVIRRESGVDDEFDGDSYETVETDLMHQITQNVEMAQVLAENRQKRETMTRKIYAKGRLSRDDLCPNMGVPTHQLDDDIIKAYTEHRAAMEKDTIFFSPRGGSLCSADGSVVYIENNAASNSLSELNRQIEDPESNVYSEGTFSEEDYKALGTFRVTDAFYKFLVSLDSWEDIAGGRFEREMYNILNNK